jgi:isocitrate/isopropylmalate dehydrogenase
VYEAVLETTAAGLRTPDLGGHAGTREFTDAVVAAIRRKLEAWDALGATA